MKIRFQVTGPRLNPENFAAGKFDPGRDPDESFRCDFCCFTGSENEALEAAGKLREIFPEAGVFSASGKYLNLRADGKFIAREICGISGKCRENAEKGGKKRISETNPDDFHIFYALMRARQLGKCVDISGKYPGTGDAENAWKTLAEILENSEILRTMADLLVAGTELEKSSDGLEIEFAGGNFAGILARLTVLAEERRELSNPGLEPLMSAVYGYIDARTEKAEITEDIFEVEKMKTDRPDETGFDAESVKNGLVRWIRDFFEENGPGCNAVVGISGGKDSSVAAALCVEALGKDRVIGILMPDGEQPDIDFSYKLVNSLGIKHYTVNISQGVRGLKNAMPADVPETRQASINLSPRIRMSTLYYLSQCMNGRVVNTCNLSEDWVGYSTRYGDAAGDFSPLSHLTVTEVKALGRLLGLPRELTDKAPSDGLSGKTDEDNLGFTYDVLDRYIRTGEIDDEQTKIRIDTLHKRNMFKLLPMPSFDPGIAVYGGENKIKTGNLTGAGNGGAHDCTCGEKRKGATELD